MKQPSVALAGCTGLLLQLVAMGFLDCHAAYTARNDGGGERAEYSITVLLHDLRYQGASLRTLEG